MPLIPRLDTLCIRCGHDEYVHTHFHSGTNCGLCDCRAFQRPRWWHKITRS